MIMQNKWEQAKEKCLAFVLSNKWNASLQQTLVRKYITFINAVVAILLYVQG